MAPEIIYATQHAIREVVDGVVETRDVPCDPRCEPDKGIHFLESTMGQLLPPIEVEG